MKKFILSMLLFCSFSNLDAQIWSRAYPTLNITSPYECTDCSFRESYVKFRIVDIEGGGQEIEIDMHDQVERSGYMPERVWNKYLGPDVPVVRRVGDRDLRRVLALIAEMEITVDDKWNWWFTYPNFELLNEWLDMNKTKYSKAKIAAAFKARYPDVESIYLWQGTPEYRRSRTSEISHVGFFGDSSPWKEAFKAAGVKLN